MPCQICHRTVTYRPGNLSEVLTGHHRWAHPEAPGLPHGPLLVGLVPRCLSEPGLLAELGRQGAVP